MIKHIYIVQCNAYIGAYKPGKCPIVSYAPREKFIDFCKSLREDYPDFKLRCVKNKGIEDKVNNQIARDIVLKKMLQNSK